MEAKTGVGRQRDPGDVSERAAIIPQNLVSGGDVTQRPTSADMRRPSSRVQSGELQRFGGPWPPPGGDGAGAAGLVLLSPGAEFRWMQPEVMPVVEGCF